MRECDLSAGALIMVATSRSPGGRAATLLARPCHTHAGYVTFLVSSGPGPLPVEAN